MVAVFKLAVVLLAASGVGGAVAGKRKSQKAKSLHGDDSCIFKASLFPYFLFKHFWVSLAAELPKCEDNTGNKRIARKDTASNSPEDHWYNAELHLDEIFSFINAVQSANPS